MSSDSDWDWASLPEELLDLILHRLIQSLDYVRFSVVCKSWLWVARCQKERRVREQHHKRVPMLLIPTKNRSRERRGLYSVTQDRVLNLELRVPYSRRCCGSSHGWLATVDEGMSITILNPFTGKTISFPPVFLLEPAHAKHTRRHPFKYEYKIHKVVLSDDPYLMPNNFVVVAIYSEFNRLAYIKPGQNSWTHIGGELEENMWTFVDGTLWVDAIFHKGNMYAVDFYSGVMSVDFSFRDEKPRVTVVFQRNLKIYGSKTTYIVESSSGEDLLLVQRYIEEKDHPTQLMTSEFKIFKLLLGRPGGLNDERVEINSIGNDAMFLGDSYSVSVSASSSNFSAAGCVRPNCIYYTDDYYPCLPYVPFGPRDTGIYSLEDGSFAQHYQMKARHRRMPPSIWIVQ